MNFPFFVKPSQVGRSRRHSFGTLSSSRRAPYSGLKGLERKRVNQRAFSPPVSQNKVSELAHNLLESGILQKEDLKLFETFTDSRAKIFLRVLNNRTRHITFVLDGVHGAHNLAAIARSCDAWGVQDLHLIAQSEQYENIDGNGNGNGNANASANANANAKAGRRYTSLVDRFDKERSVQNVSKNSHKWLTIKEHHGVESCIKELKSSGYKILVSSLSPSATPIHQVDVSTKCAFVFGNERDGVSKEMEGYADGLFTIPMMGFVESMNVSVAVGTTASQTIFRSQTIVPPKDYTLSINEKRKLAHTWLMNRFSAKGQQQKAIPGSENVTKLGPRCERRILENGMFEQADDRLFDLQNPKTATMRLSGDTGVRLADYVNRRKFGALGDRSFDKRCGTITYGLAGAHALSCGAVITRYKSYQISRSKLFKYFSRICNCITDLYTPYFDSGGSPVLPTFAPESQQVFDRLSKQAVQEIFPVCLELAQNLFDLDGSAVHRIIESASYLDLSHCITDTLGWSSEMSDVFQSEVIASLPKLPDLMRNLQEREAVRKLENSIADEHTSLSQNSNRLPEGWLAALQVFLRLSHTAFLSSEIHQAVWDRSTTRSHMARVHALRFGLLESILCEAWAESLTVPSYATLGPLRLVVEWDQALMRLKLAQQLRKV